LGLTEEELHVSGRPISLLGEVGIDNLAINFFWLLSVAPHQQDQVGWLVYGS
jgi:hypothetical protein